ncbi:helix-turn-helix domain-containing protein [Gemmobacter fulvus]|uniref:helix-turn-helix domain-containing protein n=1 Tax=Gemmobacter fulvus TaxID=2840474 RepID=UPI002796B152|nr:helix-turn-helix domain-containing protein [Gemmobacter fulvus]MDQ1850786.1 helix-turn-helix domain-containing protein [Gemmobacter fulvus]
MNPWITTTFKLNKSKQGQAAQLWCGYMSEVYFPLECSPRDSSSFEGALSALQLSTIGISKFTANAMRTVRRRQTSGEDEVVFIFPTRNREKFNHFGLEDEVGPGEVYVLNSSEAYWTMIEDNSSNVTIKAPASYIRQRFPSIDSTYGRRGIANIGLVPIVSHLALQTFRLAPSADPGILKRAEDNIIDLVCLMLETQSIQDVHESATTALADVTLQRLSAFLSCHYRDPGLSPEHAASSLRVSVRYVHKIYQMNGTTFGRELLRLRLLEADRMLRTPPGKNALPRPISEIAYACGFCSQSHFSVRYKQHFGITPGESRSAL